MRLSCIFFWLLVWFSNPIIAQKVGHLNFGNLLVSMPESKIANDELKALQQELIQKGEEMEKKLLARISQFERDQKAGKLSPSQASLVEKEFQNEKKAIQDFEDEIVQKIQERRQSLLLPIAKKARNAIQEIGKERGYSLIFDTSALFNAILYTKESEDLMPFVRAKLGLK